MFITLRYTNRINDVQIIGAGGGPSESNFPFSSVWEVFDQVISGKLAFFCTTASTILEEHVFAQE